MSAIDYVASSASKAISRALLYASLTAISPTHLRIRLARNAQFSRAECSHAEGTFSNARSHTTTRYCTQSSLRYYAAPAILRIISHAISPHHRRAPLFIGASPSAFRERGALKLPGTCHVD
eukprot:6179226-Pleurochrysis_carterae.AAC.1